MSPLSFFSDVVASGVEDIQEQQLGQSSKVVCATALSAMPYEFSSDIQLNSRDIDVQLAVPEKDESKIEEDYLSGLDDAEEEEEDSGEVDSQLSGIETSGEGEENSKRDETDGAVNEGVSSSSKGAKLLEAIRQGDFDLAKSLIESGAFAELDANDKQRLIGELLELLIESFN